MRNGGTAISPRFLWVPVGLYEITHEMINESMRKERQKGEKVDICSFL
jgi:hypothetical protein